MLHFRLTIAAFIFSLLFPAAALAQDASPSPSPLPVLQAVAGSDRLTIVDKKVTFDSSASQIPSGADVQEVVWDFGDGVRTTGAQVVHAYAQPGTYRVRLSINTSQGSADNTIQVRVFGRVIVLLADSRAPADQLALYQQQAADEKTLLFVLRAPDSASESLAEEDLTQQLTNAQDEVREAHVIATWTTGSVGLNVLSRFAQHIKQARDLSLGNFDSKGVIIFSDNPFGVLAPTAQSLFDQLHPAYLLLTRPSALPLIFAARTSDDARNNISESQLEHRLLGTFSSRVYRTPSLFNFMSYGLNFLVNRGVPINNLVLILMIPVIATLLAFARQVIGLKAFGLITPAMTTLAFLVMGLYSGLIVFVVVVLSGTLTRLLLSRLRLLYLPRMALVLTSVSLAILILLGLSAATGQTATLAFSVFPILILTVLAEDFIAVQFTRGLKTALRLTFWTLVLVVACYYIVSWQLLRTFLLSYPEVVLLAIPINILLGRFTGLRILEYIRFRELLRYGPRVE